jgi:hypothetical protein
MWRSTLFSLALALTISGCGGGGGGGGGSDNPPGPPPPPVDDTSLPIFINGALNSHNRPFVSLTVCIPGTGTCEMIDNIILDTGSNGLRIVSSALKGLTLPPAKIGEKDLGECEQFVSSYTWGMIRSADVKLAGYTLEKLSIQIIGDTAGRDVPSNCKLDKDSKELPPLADDLRGNGILGVGLFAQDCGAACVNSDAGGKAYYACSGTECQATTVPLNRQLQNPVALLPADNNGVVVELPNISSEGANFVEGTLYLGIGTRDNNGLGNATVLHVNASNAGFFSTRFNNTDYYGFLDTGAAYFDFKSNIKKCSGVDDENASAFYCPESTQSLEATNKGTNDAVTSVVTFEVANATTLQNSQNVAFNNLGTYSTNQYGSKNIFLWGLPFFFDRKVFIAIEGRDTPAGKGPYFAYSQ